MFVMDEVNREQGVIFQKDVIYGHQVSQTNEAKWLCLDNIYQKFYRPNLYDIGGTYIQDVADYWFLCKTESVGPIFLLHLFVSNRHESSFNVAVSFNSELRLDKRNGIAYLPSSLKEYRFKKTKEMSQLYLTTYSFYELDVDLLKDKKMYIAVSFAQTEDKDMTQEIIDNVKVNHDFSALLTDPISSDFVIESAEGKEFNVHRVLLMAHSDVFKAMLKDDTAESQNGYVQLVNVSTEDLKGILEFIYTGTIKDLENTNFVSLLTLADQYNLDGLRELCQLNLSQELTTENALAILIIADMHNSDSLKHAALKFIKKNVAALQSCTFNDMKNPELIRELCMYIMPHT